MRILGGPGDIHFPFAVLANIYVQERPAPASLGSSAPGPACAAPPAQSMGSILPPVCCLLNCQCCFSNPVIIILNLHNLSQMILIQFPISLRQWMANQSALNIQRKRRYGTGKPKHSPRLSSPAWPAAQPWGVVQLQEWDLIKPHTSPTADAAPWNHPQGHRTVNAQVASSTAYFLRLFFSFAGVVFQPLQMLFSSKHPQQCHKEGATIRRIYSPRVPGNRFLLLNFSEFPQLPKNVLEPLLVSAGMAPRRNSTQLYGGTTNTLPGITSSFQMD